MEYLLDEWKGLGTIVRTLSQSHVKIKNLVSKYRKVQGGNNITGNNRQDFVFCDALDSILGTIPVSQPDTIMSSSTSLSGPQN